MSDTLNNPSAEEEKIWADDAEPDFNELRAAMEADEAAEVTDEVIEENTDEIMEQSEANTEDSNIDAVDETEDTTVVEETVEGQTDETKEVETVTETEQPQKYNVKANNMDFEFTAEELIALAPKAMDYTKKMQEIAPYRKSISAMKEAGFGQDDMNLMIDVLKGNPEAMAEVMKRTGVDVDALDDIDDETKAEYVPNQYGKDEGQLAIEEVVNEISQDEEYVITQRVVDNEWDGNSRTALAENPTMIKGLHSDIKNGIYDKVAPMAFKMKALDGGQLSDLEYYMKAGQEFYANEDNVNALQSEADRVKQVEDKNARNANSSKSRKAASITKSNSGKRDVLDYLDDDEESYNEWYKNVTNN